MSKYFFADWKEAIFFAVTLMITYITITLFYAYFKVKEEKKRKAMMENIENHCNTGII